MEASPLLLVQIYFTLYYTYKFSTCIKRLKILSQGENRVLAEIIHVREENRRLQFPSQCRYYPTYQYNIDGNIIERESKWGYDYAAGQFAGRKIVICYDKIRADLIVPEEDAEKIKKDTLINAGFAIIFFLLFSISIYRRMFVF